MKNRFEATENITIIGDIFTFNNDRYNVYKYLGMDKQGKYNFILIYGCRDIFYEYHDKYCIENNIPLNSIGFSGSFPSNFIPMKNKLLSVIYSTVDGIFKRVILLVLEELGYRVSSYSGLSETSNFIRIRYFDRDAYDVIDVPPSDNDFIISCKNLTEFLDIAKRLIQN